MDVVLRCVDATPSAAQVSDVVDRLAALFLAMQKPAARPTRGLWAELLIIVSASNPVTMVDAWHNDNTERFDFGLGMERVEVKGSSDRRRIHHFSFEQAHPPSGVTAVVASLFVEHAAGGRSLGDLWDEARQLVGQDPELRLKVERICIDALGNDWPQAREAAFDEHLARQSLAFFDVRYIPRISHDQPPGVSNIHFASDLTIAQSLTRRDLSAGGELLRCYAQLA